MPRFVSRRQARAFYSAAEGKSRLGISTREGKVAVADNAGRDLKRLPLTKRKKLRRGKR